MGQSISHDGTLRPSEPSLTRPSATARSGPSPSTSSAAPSPPPECPMHDASSSSTHSLDALQALQAQLENNMPELPQSRAPGQTTSLDLERTISSIPRKAEQRRHLPGSTDAEGSTCPVAGPSTAILESDRRWVYPSPQQFHNALVRKGKAAPEESVGMMVNIHNWLNESAWMEIRRWEETITGCLACSLHHALAHVQRTEAIRQSCRASRADRMISHRRRGGISCSARSFQSDTSAREVVFYPICGLTIAQHRAALRSTRLERLASEAGNDAALRDRLLLGARRRERVRFRLCLL